MRSSGQGQPNRPARSFRMDRAAPLGSLHKACLLQLGGDRSGDRHEWAPIRRKAACNL